MAIGQTSKRRDAATGNSGGKFAARTWMPLISARAIAQVCAKYPGCVLVFERLRKIAPKGGSKSHRLNRKQANHLRGQSINRRREKAYAASVVTVEVNPWGTSQHCSRCGAKGERFSRRSRTTGQRARWQALLLWGHAVMKRKLITTPV